jgi:hypothetical protein
MWSSAPINPFLMTVILALSSFPLHHNIGQKLKQKRWTSLIPFLPLAADQERFFRCRDDLGQIKPRFFPGARQIFAPALRGHTQVPRYEAFDRLCALRDVGADLRVRPGQRMPMQNSAAPPFFPIAGEGIIDC